MDIQLLVQLLVNGIMVGALYGVVAMCFVMIYKASQVVNFAQGELLLVGAWICWFFAVKYQLPFYVAFPITLAFMMLLGMLIQVVVLRPMIGEPIISVIMATIGISIFLQALMKWMFGVSAQPFPPLFARKTIEILGLQVQTEYAASTLASLFIMAGFAYFFKFSRMGMAMRAASYDQQVAQSLGISVRQVFALSWAISAAISAVAGVVIGIVNGVSSGLSAFGIKVFPAVILGGLDSIVGGVVGGLAIGIIENLGHYVDRQFLHWGNLHEVVPFYVLVIILIIKPYGLFGTRDIERV